MVNDNIIELIPNEDGVFVPVKKTVRHRIRKDKIIKKPDASGFHPSFFPDDQQGEIYDLVRGIQVGMQFMKMLNKRLR